MHDANHTIDLVNQRCNALCGWMRKRDVAGFIIPSTDPHASEYAPAHWMTREWISGFTGSAGTAVVAMSTPPNDTTIADASVPAAALWTDSRYYLQAEEQLDGTPFRLMRESDADTPTIAQWLASILPTGSAVGIDGTVNMVADLRKWQEEFASEGLRLKVCDDPAEELWTGRPLLPQTPVEIQPLQWAGESTRSKLKRVREQLLQSKADTLLVTQLDEIAWLTNLRGDDVHCTPTFVAYALVTQESATLYINKEKLTPETVQLLAECGFSVSTYMSIFEVVRSEPIGRLMWNPSTTNCALWQAFGGSSASDDNNATASHVELPSPIAEMKAVKNAAEIAGFHEAMRQDGVAMVRFLRWLRPAVEEGGITEMEVDRQLTAFRSQSPLFRDLSFDTIAAYGAHGAIVHYEATPETDTTLEPRGLLLLDSGAQYACGTTDITRTIPLGQLTDEERRDYTLVLKGHIRLAMTRFPKGTAGTQIDAMARYAMWQEGINYGHGTGHGVGSRLSVHEGPHQIRMQWRPAGMLSGMTVTNEPGIYRAGKHGVRIENTMLITPYCTTEFGEFLQLEALTLCPISMEPVIREMLTPDERKYLNTYHQRVYDELSPLLTEDEREWLRQETLKL